MTSQRTAFVVPFVAASAAVGWLVAAHRPIAAVAAGTIGILLHWALSARGSAEEGELPDASYFFGFLLTLVFLAGGLYWLGAGGSPPGAVDRTLDVRLFLRDLAAGLVLTIVGLLVRQVRVLGLSAAPDGDTVPARDAALIESMHELTAALRAHGAEEAREANGSAREAAEALDTALVATARRLESAMERLESAAQQTSDAVLRAGNSLSEGVTHTTGRMQSEADALLQSMRRQHEAADEALRHSVETADAVRRETESQLQLQLAEWHGTLTRTQALLATAHERLEVEYTRGLEQFAGAGRAFADLAGKVAAQVESLPDPAARLATLWTSVQALEGGLVDSMGRVTSTMTELEARAANAASGVSAVGGASRAAAERLAAETGMAADTLRRELRQIDQLLEEFVTVLEGRVAAYTR
jgi:hypothetical protein